MDWSGDQPMKMLRLGSVLASASKCTVGADHVLEVLLVPGVAGSVNAETGVQVTRFRAG